METNTTTWTPTEGADCWDRVHECNVTVERVYKTTATISMWGRGLLDGQRVTFRGVRLDRLSPKRRIARDADGFMVRDERGEFVYAAPEVK